MRVKRSVPARAKHKKILKLAKGMQHNRTRSFRLAKQAVIRALQYSQRATLADVPGDKRGELDAPETRERPAASHGTPGEH